MSAPSLKPLLPALVAVRPMVQLSGFLGAGKTTFLRRCLTALSAREMLADVILNDRENPDIDCEGLRDHAASVAPLAGSCVCCDGLQELAELVVTASKSRHDVLFVELNGTADPVPLLETFTLMESRFRIQPRWQVCVIDARHFGKRSTFRDLEVLQLETASHYHISHAAEMDEQALDELRRRLREANVGASETDPETLSDQLVQAVSHNRRWAIARSSEIGPSRSLPKLGLPDPRHRLAHEFTGCQILLPEKVQALNLIAWLTTLPDSVIRAKALARVVDRPDVRLLFERVGDEVCPEPIEVPIADRVPASAILIGADLEPAELLESARRQMGADCQLG